MLSRSYIPLRSVLRTTELVYIKSKEPERNTLETNNRHRVESLSSVYTKPLRDVTRPYKFVIQDHDAPLHAKHSYELENSQEIRLEIWS
jgi:hypothetical protein